MTLKTSIFVYSLFCEIRLSGYVKATSINFGQERISFRLENLYNVSGKHFFTILINIKLFVMPQENKYSLEDVKLEGNLNFFVLP